MKRAERRGEEAAVWLPRDRAPINYVPKHKKRDTALEVVFDPKAHKCAGEGGRRLERVFGCASMLGS